MKFANMEKNEVMTLEDRGFIQATGAEAKSFLQNIVTNDLEKVTNKSTVFSSILTPQGKYLFEFFILKLQDSFILECEKKSTEEIIKLLNFYKLRSMFPDADQRLKEFLHLNQYAENEAETENFSTSKKYTKFYPRRGDAFWG